MVTQQSQCTASAVDRESGHPIGHEETTPLQKSEVLLSGVVAKCVSQGRSKLRASIVRALWAVGRPGGRKAGRSLN